MPRTSSHRPVRGSVIAIVLAVIALASFLLAAFIERSTTELLVETRAAQTARLRQAAHSGFEAALAVVAAYQAEDGGLFAPAQGWGEPLAGRDLPAPGGVRVRVLDETGRPSLPRLDPPALAALLADLGLRREEAERVAEALAGWTRAGGGSARRATEVRQYAFAEPPHRAPGRPLGSFAELAAVAVARDFFFDDEGRPTELLGRLAAEVSLHDFPAVNVNTATPRSWSLAGVTPADAARSRARLAAGEGRRPAAPRYARSADEARALLGPLPAGFDVRARVLRVVVIAREGAAEYRLEAVVTPGAEERGATDPNAPPPPAAASALPFTLLGLEESIVLDAPLA